MESRLITSHSYIDRFCNASVDLYISNTAVERNLACRVATYVLAFALFFIGTVILVGIPLIYKCVKLYVSKTIEIPLKNEKEHILQQAASYKQKIEGDLLVLNDDLAMAHKNANEQAAAEKNSPYQSSSLLSVCANTAGTGFCIFNFLDIKEISNFRQLSKLFATCAHRQLTFNKASSVHRYLSFYLCVLEERNCLVLSCKSS